ncbi:histidine phosphatase family protein [Clostridiales bacterium COT073_COT-073]|nr:histidine phosphatase family protein [Clostridiales bacterium COT073_COT-073]
MKTNIFFVRHAEPNYENHDDMTRELTEKGRKDRQWVTETLRNKNITAVLSSPYKRSYDTIKPFAEERNLAIEVVDDFRERKVDSEWIEDFNAFCRKQWRDFDYKLSDGESLKEVQDRNIQALQIVLEKYAGQNIIIATHGTSLSTILHYYMEFGYSGFERIRRKMPWIVCLAFEGQQYIGMKEWDIEDWTGAEKK